MNQEQAKAWLPLIEAIAEGKTIQRVRSDGTISDEQWFDYNGRFKLEIDLPADCYRIKPEPKKEWVRVGLWRTGLSDRCYASNEEDEIRLQSRPFFGGWLTDRIEYELPEEEV